MLTWTVQLVFISINTLLSHTVASVNEEFKLHVIFFFDICRMQPLFEIPPIGNDVLRATSKVDSCRNNPPAHYVRITHLYTVHHIACKRNKRATSVMLKLHLVGHNRWESFVNHIVRELTQWSLGERNQALLPSWAYFLCPWHLCLQYRVLLLMSHTAPNAYTYNISRLLRFVKIFTTDANCHFNGIPF